MTDSNDSDNAAEIRAITAAFLDRDIEEALRILADRLERFRAELERPDIDAARRAELERDIRCDEFMRSRLLI
jgi:hypothetical protein